MPFLTPKRLTINQIIKCFGVLYPLSISAQNIIILPYLPLPFAYRPILSND
jgi:hypothetical protein